MMKFYTFAESKSVELSEKQVQAARGGGKPLGAALDRSWLLGVGADGAGSTEAGEILLPRRAYAGGSRSRPAAL